MTNVPTSLNLSTNQYQIDYLLGIWYKTLEFISFGIINNQEMILVILF